MSWVQLSGNDTEYIHVAFQACTIHHVTVRLNTLGLEGQECFEEVANSHHVGLSEFKLQKLWANPIQPQGNYFYL